jgi:hypothetical protein
MHYNE